jgi:hypothetical protein
MPTKLDNNFARTVIEGVKTLIEEVERLERQVLRYEDALQYAKTAINSLGNGSVTRSEEAMRYINELEKPF